MQAARWGGYRIDEFFQLPQDMMEFIIAGYRIERQIEAVQANEQNKKMKANRGKSKVPRRRGRS